MKYESNCIVFEAAEASLYDDTRPFMPAGAARDTFRRLSDLLQEAARAGADIELLDLGAGTGRVALPFAKEYAWYRSQHPNAPRLRMTCVDLSEAMLSKLDAKWAEAPAAVKDSVRIECKRLDVRDLTQYPGRFDVAIAHWIFHLIEDWRLAIYAADQVVLPTGLLFVLTEHSDLYSAIDGDCRGVSSAAVGALWKAFYDERAKFDDRSPRLRLGTLVVDDRIEGMFHVLGWQRAGAQLDTSWDSDRTLGWVIDNVIRPRSFTNMQLYANVSEAEAAYSAIAVELRDRFRNDLGAKWTIHTSLSAQVLKRGLPMPVPPRQAFLDVARATLALRRQRPLKTERSLVPVWGRLLRETWRRLSPLASDRAAPLRALFDSNGTGIVAAYVSAPSAAGLQREECIVVAEEASRDAWQAPDVLWDGLTRGIEICEPFAVCVGQSGPELARIREEWERGARVHPSLRLLSVGSEASVALRKVADRAKDPTKVEAAVQEALAAVGLDVRWCSDLLHEAARLGLIPYDYCRIAVPFLSAVARLAAADVPLTYVLPAVPAQTDQSTPALGFLVAACSALPSESTTILWLLGETVLAEYHAWTSALSGAGVVEQVVTVVKGDAPSRGAASQPISPDELAESAVQLLHPLREVPLNSYRVVGDYVRYGDDTLAEVRRIAQWIRGACERRTDHLENMLLWAPSGQGKTFLVEEVARTTQPLEFIRVDMKDQSLDAAAMRRHLEKCREAATPHLCLIDEVDARPEDKWICEVLFDYLNFNREKGGNAPNDVFVIVGSTKGGIASLAAVVEGMPKGPDVLSRVSTRFAIPPLSLGDRLLIVLSQLRRRARETNRQLLGAEKVAVMYILCRQDMVVATQLRDFVGRAFGRMKSGEDVLTLGHLFEYTEYSLLEQFMATRRAALERLGKQVVYLAD